MCSALQASRATRNLMEVAHPTWFPTRVSISTHSLHPQHPMVPGPHCCHTYCPLLHTPPFNTTRTLVFGVKLVDHQKSTEQLLQGGDALGFFTTQGLRIKGSSALVHNLVKKNRNPVETADSRKKRKSNHQTETNPKNPNKQKEPP